MDRAASKYRAADRFYTQAENQCTSMIDEERAPEWGLSLIRFILAYTLRSNVVVSRGLRPEDSIDYDVIYRDIS